MLGLVSEAGAAYKTTADVKVGAEGVWGGSDERTIRGSTLKLDGVVGRLGGSDG